MLQIKELKSRLQEENTESDISVKEEMNLPDPEDKMTERSKLAPEISIPGSESKDLNYECFNSGNVVGAASLFPADIKDGSSDSDSSAVLNEDNSPNAAAISLRFNCSSPSSMNCFQYQRSTYQAQYVKIEEPNFLSADEACNFFSDEQAPTLPWWS